MLTQIYLQTKDRALETVNLSYREYAIWPRNVEILYQSVLAKIGSSSTLLLI